MKLPAPSVVILIGPSGSGKTTWAHEHFSANEVVSSDALRAMVGAGEDDQTASTAAFAVLEKVVAERIRRGLTVVIDTLGYDSDARQRWIEMAHDASIEAHGIVFDTPGELCEERNSQRKRPVPKTVLQKQLSRFRAVKTQLEDDGFDGVHLQQPTAVVATPLPAATFEDDTSSPTPTGHTFGLIVSSFNWDGPMPGTLASIAQRAEAAGFRDLWVMDHFRQIRGVGRPWEDIPEAYTTLSFLSAQTEKIRLGALVTGITHRHPTVLGKMIATLDVLSNGRAICGLGAAWDEEEHAAYGIDFPDISTRYEILEETCQLLPLLWGKGTPEFRGNHIDSPGLISYPRPVQNRIPIMIGGSGEKKTLRLVARYANMCNVFGDPDRVRHKVEVLHEHCAAEDRDPSEIEVSHLTNALGASDRSTLRSQVENLRDRNTPPEAFMKRNNAGTVDDLEDLFTAYSRAGADHSIVAIPNVTEDGSLEVFGDVIARFTAP